MNVSWLETVKGAIFIKDNEMKELSKKVLLSSQKNAMITFVAMMCDAEYDRLLHCGPHFRV
jgi:hypothetical protein